ncbi:hypothetical protein [Nocardioides sp.]|uniref:hypothetical protein n=1 Tax=Nocardioides sp. TaxID=35761 RepID=UPI0035669867
MSIPARFATVLTIGALGLLSACSGDSEADKDAEEFIALSAQEIADAANAAMGELTAVSIKGTINADGQAISIDMSLGEGGDCTGSVGIEDATAELLGVGGTMWFKPDDAFWVASAGDDLAEQIVDVVDGRWVKLPADDSSFAQFCQIDDFIDSLVDEEATDKTYTKGEVEELDGEEVISVVSSQPDRDDGTGLIRVSGTHYLVQITTEGEDSGEVSFTDFDEAPEVSAPADDDQVTIEEVQSSVS